jgi:D-arabinose 1-dehydrogenase-like Zn-dependent alcohol dehydrogenase
MKVAQASKAGGPFEIVERDIPAPGPGQVRIKVEACGVCHGDMLVKSAVYPGLQLPRVPGHEIGGRIDAVGNGVTQWKPGQHVGVGWHGGHCFVCDAWRRGDFILCANEKITGISFDGGYGEYTIVPAAAVAAIPDSLPLEEAAPLLCAGITVFNSMRNSGTQAGDLVAVQGIGGLGHLGVQFARQMGFRTVAIGRGGEKEGSSQKAGGARVHRFGRDGRSSRVEEAGGARD